MLIDQLVQFCRSHTYWFDISYGIMEPEHAWAYDVSIHDAKTGYTRHGKSTDLDYAIHAVIVEVEQGWRR